MHLLPLFLVHLVGTVLHELRGSRAVIGSTIRIPYREGFLQSEYSRHSTLSTSFLAARNKAKSRLLAQKSSDTSWGSKNEDHAAKLRAFNALKHWLAANGALLDVHGLTLEPRPQATPCTLASHETEIRGLTAARAYRRGELLASIPLPLRFDLELLEQFVNGVTGGQAARDCEASRYRETEDETTSVTKADQNIRLAFPLGLFQLLQSEFLDRRKPSAFRDTTCRGIPLARLYQGWLLYARLLAPPPETFPLFWKATEVRALEHPIASSVFERHYRLRRSFPHFEVTVRKNLSLQGSVLDSKALFEKLLSAYATTISRNVRLPSKDKAFVPLIDLCDHAADGGNARLILSKSSVEAGLHNEPEDSFDACESDDGRCSHERGFIQVVATTDISPGQGIRVSYGKFETPTLLLNYGLLPSVNPHDKVDVEFSPQRVHFALRAIGLERLMVADDFSFLGPRVVKQLAKLGLTACGAKGKRADECARVKLAPVITVRGDAKLDERLIAAAKILAANDYEEVKNDDEQSEASSSEYHNFVKMAAKFREGRRKLLSGAIADLQASLEGNKTT